MDGFRMHRIELKKLVSKATHCYDAIYMTPWKKQNYRDGGHINGHQGLELGKHWLQEVQRNLGHKGIISDLDCGDGYLTIYIRQNSQNIHQSRWILPCVNYILKMGGGGRQTGHVSLWKGYKKCAPWLPVGRGRGWRKG